MINAIDIVKIKTMADQRIQSNGVERLGQAVYNAACELYPIKAKTLKGTKYDPFYEDSRITDFLHQLQKL